MAKSKANEGRLHLRLVEPGVERAACYWITSPLTDDPDAVTCPNCKRTRLFREGPRRPYRPALQHKSQDGGPK